jgi:SAM-dependent methyltransferase
MSTDRDSLGRSFDSVADAYERYRPGYPPALFDDLGSLVTLGESSSVLEIGCGTGQATGALLERGCTVLAVEPGESMVSRARSKFAGRSFVAELSTFEAWSRDGRLFDVIFSATAFHWTDPSRRWPLAHEALREGGHVALATNRTSEGGSFDEFYLATGDLHRRFGVGGDESRSPSIAAFHRELARARDVGALWAAAEPVAGPSDATRYFAPPVYRTYEWTDVYRTEEAIGLLSTYSTYLVLAPEARTELLDELAALIDERFGGSLTRHYLSILAVAARLDSIVRSP